MKLIIDSKRQETNYQQKIDNHPCRLESIISFILDFFSINFLLYDFDVRLDVGSACIYGRPVIHIH